VISPPGVAVAGDRLSGRIRQTSLATSLLQLQTRMIASSSRTLEDGACKADECRRDLEHRDENGPSTGLI